MINKEELYADRLNRKLKYAGGILKAGSQDIALRVYPLLLKLSGKDRIHKNENNDYFYMDSSWDGSNYTLWQHVHFKKIPMDDENKKHVQHIEEEGHMSKKNYAKFVDDWHHKSYETITGDKKLNLENSVELENIMNSSAAWHLAVRGSYDSEQALERWQFLYERANKAFKADSDLYNWVIQQIQNEKKSLNHIANVINDEIKLMLAGKYSRRFEKQY